MRSLILLALCSFLLVLNAPSYAATVVPPFAEAGRIQERFQPSVQPKSLPRTKPIRLPTLEALLKSKSIKLTVSKFEVVGSNIYQDSDFENLIAQYINREITISDIYALSYKITALYENDGYVLTRAIITPQDLEPQNAVVRIEISESYIDKIIWPAGLKDKYRDFFSFYEQKILSEKVVNINTIACYMLLASDLPRIRLTLIFQASAENNSKASTLIVTQDENGKDSQILNIDATIDNRGSDATPPSPSDDPPLFAMEEPARELTEVTVDGEENPLSSQKPLSEEAQNGLNRLMNSPKPMSLPNMAKQALPYALMSNGAYSAENYESKLVSLDLLIKEKNEHIRLLKEKEGDQNFTEEERIIFSERSEMLNLKIAQAKGAFDQALAEREKSNTQMAELGYEYVSSWKQLVLNMGHPTLADVKGFSGSIYKGKDGEMVFSFAGTTNSMGDIASNARHYIQMYANKLVGVGPNEGMQYGLAAFVTGLAQKKYGDKLVLAGHSLGGSLAEHASAVTGVKAYAFNSTGVAISVKGKANVVNINLSNDIATKTSVQSGSVYTYKADTVLSRLSLEKDSLRADSNQSVPIAAALIPFAKVFRHVSLTRLPVQVEEHSLGLLIDTLKWYSQTK